jgi:hypothetical protein
VDTAHDVVVGVLVGGRSDLDDAAGWIAYPCSRGSAPRAPLAETRLVI